MTLQAAQERYDNMLPPEYLEEHCYTGEIVVEDDNGEPTLFEFFMGQIHAASIDEDGTMVPYAKWNGCDKLAEKADAQASAIWSAS